MYIFLYETIHSECLQSFCFPPFPCFGLILTNKTSPTIAVHRPPPLPCEDVPYGRSMTTLQLTFSRRLDHLEEYSHHGLGALSAVPLHRRELDGEEVVKVLRSEWRARCQRRSFCLPRGFRHTNKFVIFNLAAISTFGSDLQH